MIGNVKYVHTNIIADDLQRLVKFYTDVLGCTLVPPERDLHGKALEAGTSIPEARLKGAHLRLPGCGANGPTLEIFTYSQQETKLKSKVNHTGYGHIAFGVDDVNAARDEVLSAGGKPVGEVVTVQLSSGEKITWCYVTDPEGNIIELQAKS